MPTIPKLERPGTTLNAAPSVRLRGQNMQAPQSLNQKVVIPDTSNAFSKTKAAFSDLAMAAKKRADTTALTEAQSRVDEWELQNLYGKNGALNTQGKAAFDLPQKVGGDYSQLISDIAKDLNNDDQKMAFNQWSSARRVSTQKSLLQHESREFQSYSQNQMLAGIELSTQRALASGDPADIAEAENHMLGIINANAAGNSSEVVQINRMKATTNLYTGLIENYVDTDIAKAKAYFKTNKDKIDPSKHDDIQKKINAGSVKQDALYRSDNILAQHEGYEDQINEAKKIKDQKTRDAVLGRIDSNYARGQRVKAAAADDVDNLLAESLGGENPVAFDALPVSLQLKASEADERRYKTAYEKLTGVDKFDEDESMVFYDDVMTEYEQNPESILKIGRTQIMGMKPGKERDELLKKRREYYTKGADAPEAGQSEFNEIISLYTEGVLGLNPKKSAGKNTAREFRNAMRIQAQDFEEKNDRKASYEELQKIADRQIEKVTIKEKLFFDDVQQRFEIDRDDLDIGQTERDAVIWSLKQSGTPRDRITDDMITDSAYRFLKHGGTLEQLVREFKNARK